MAKRPDQPAEQRPARSKPAGFSSDVTWVNYTLTDEHKQALDQLVSKKPEFLELEMNDAAQDGYRWSIAWDTYANCFTVTMFTREVSSSNYGLMMSSRSKSWYKALLMCLYKHTLVFEGKWIVAPETERDWEG